MGLWTNTIARIILRHVEVHADGCWIWTGKKDYGYGRVGYQGKNYRAHRLFYEAFKGPIPEGLCIDHLCRNHACVNPDHLEPVTTKENNRRGPGAKTHCVNGHLLSGENLYLTVKQRSCKICRREAVKRNRTRKAVA